MLVPSDIPDSEVKRVVKALKKAKLSGDVLDDIVHEALSNTAAGINNAGYEAQVRFLMEEGFDLEQLLEWVE